MDTATPLPVRAPEVLPPLDYYLILPEAPAESSVYGPGVRPEGVVVEEFVLAEDFSAVGLHSTGWTPAPASASGAAFDMAADAASDAASGMASDAASGAASGAAGRPAADWWRSAALSRGMRVDPALRARVVPVGREDAETAFRRLGGGDLPDESTLRTHFEDYEPLADSAPLRLGSDEVPGGFADKRVYRILFAKELSAERQTDLLSHWQMVPADDPSDPQARVIGTTSRHLSGDVFTWDLRRIGAAVAWCVDLTAHLSDGSVDRIGLVLRELRTDMRRQGLIPVTVERFS